MTLSEIILRMCAAVVAGAVIGLERQMRDKAAGLRTHILVALGAATYLVMSSTVAIELGETKGVTLDPLRVVGGLVGGVGFLAAGVILEQRGNIHGLTTAASLWMAAALGAGAGLGQYALVAVAVTITLLVLWPIQYVEHRVLENDKKKKKKAHRESNAESAEDEG